jgi:hypothetical protein
MTLLQPDRTVDFVSSLIAAQESSPFGILPVWAYEGHGNLVHDRLPRRAGSPMPI